ncbi:Protein CBG19063 [Caenorhabditis briggsae]|uniref:Protein CBG19063 n=1 Tax=Caenorhabditis briggsae TaxID=6238 RepID=A8XUP6_CAEBR|nr:Protein CBG19063 [Caenorhabditis briggsae]CAP36371.1 Protein CBG19063 [Caenorhabditis briggsae]
MCRLLIVGACIAVAVFAAEEAKSEMTSAGISETVVDGILAIAEKYKEQFKVGKGDREAAKAAFQAFHTETEQYIATQSEADQAAYKAFVEKKKSEHHGRRSTPSA